MKKTWLMGISLVLAFSLTACAKDGESKASEAEKSGETSGVSENVGNAEVTFTPGKYIGKGTGYNGPMEVEVTFDEKKITDIKVTAHKETPQVGDIAFEPVITDIKAANGTGVDRISGATFSSAGLQAAVNDAAAQAKVSDIKAFKGNTIKHEAQQQIEETYDVIVIGGGGAGIAAAAQAALDGSTVVVVERNAQVGGNTVVSGGQYQSVQPYLVWDPKNPSATEGEYNGQTYAKVKSDVGRIHTLKTILEWDEKAFDGTIDAEHPFVAGDIESLSKRGVHAEYLPLLKELKAEIGAYLDWAQPQLDSGKPENSLTLFSTLNLHIFQTYYGGLRPNVEQNTWVYSSYELAKQMVVEGQELKPWLEKMGAAFKNDLQPTLIGALWQRENVFIGATIDGKEYPGRWGTYFEAPLQAIKKANEKNLIMTRTTAKALISENGRVVGVEAERFDGTPVILKATKGVVLSTGGYAANVKEVLATNDYWSKDALTDRIGTTNRNSLQGDGLTMAKAVGAQTTGMGFTQLMPLGWVQGGNLAFGGGEDVIYLNPTTGKRYVDETSERDVLSATAFANGIEYNGVKGVFIEIGNATSPIPGPYPYQDEDVEMRQYVRDASDAEGIQAILKTAGASMTYEQLMTAIKEYDDFLLGRVDKLEIEKAGYRNLIGTAEKDAEGKWLPDTYKLEKVRIRFLSPSTHHTMGGLVVDTQRHVLDADGKPIPGLYAAGEVTGGIHGGNRLGGNAIVEILVSGRAAAKAIQEDAQKK